MRILYLAHRIPDAPDKGEKVRAFHQLRALAARHEVHVFALDDEGAARDPVWRSEVASLSVTPVSRIGSALRTARAGITGSSLSAAHFSPRRLKRELRQALGSQQFDVAVVYSGAVDPLVGGFRPRVLDLVDVDSAKFEAYHRERAARGLKHFAYGVESRRLHDLEAAAVADADVTLVCTERERDLLLSRTRPRRLEVIGNGVDLNAFPFGDAGEREAGEILFVGALDYLPNVEAAVRLVQEILPRVRRELPDVKVTLVGRHPAGAVRELEGPGVELIANPPSVLPYLARATLTVLPFRIARGIQNKALEALASGLPVVLTPGPAAALDGESDRDFAVADGDEELARTTVELLQNAGRRADLAVAGRRLAERCYGWEAVLERFVSLVEEVGRSRVTETASGERTDQP